jgi:import receptor subunit TOM70
VSHLRFHVIFTLEDGFRFLCGDSDGAKEDLLKSTALLPSFTQSWVKLASVYMEQGDSAATFASFETAIKHNGQDPDIYYHRGQGESSLRRRLRE